MAEDLLEEMEEGGKGDVLDGNGGSSGKKMRLNRLLGNKKKLIVFLLAIVLVLSGAAGGGFCSFQETVRIPVLIRLQPNRMRFRQILDRKRKSFLRTLWYWNPLSASR